MGVVGVSVMSLAEAREAAIDAVHRLSNDVNIPQTLKELGVKEEDLPMLAEQAIHDACVPNNPRPCDVDLVLELYKTAFNGS